MTDFANAVISWGPTPSTTTLLDLMKQVLGITDTLQDESLSMFLDMSGNACERYLDNILDHREVTELFKNVFSPIALRYWPVRSLASVVVDGIDKTSEYKEVFQDGLGWVLKAFADGSQLSTCFEQMEVTYGAGYDPLPSDLGYAIVQGAISYEASAKTAGSAAIIKKESIVGVGSVEYDTGSTASEETVGMLPSFVTSALDKYARIGA